MHTVEVVVITQVFGVKAVLVVCRGYLYTSQRSRACVLHPAESFYGETVLNYVLSPPLCKVRARKNLGRLEMNTAHLSEDISAVA